MPQRPIARAVRSTRSALDTTVGILLLLVGVYFANLAVGGRLIALGIVPRTAWGLVGVVCSPFLHGDLSHLMANCVSATLLLVILFADKTYKAEQALGWIWLLSGLGTWLIGRQSMGGALMVHIGASGVIYGLVTYLICSAFWLQSWRSAFFSLLVFVFYAGALYGVLPQEGGMSWEGHLSGAVAGWWTARRHHARGGGR